MANTFPIAWREVGEGDPVVFLHGLGGTSGAWGPQFRGLGHAMRCVAWDMPGYGGSAPIDPLTYETIAGALIALLDHLEIERADLVGLSFGGMHALHTALAAPDRVRRLVLADTSPAFGIDGTSVEEWTNARLAPLDEGLTPGDLGPRIIDAITANPLEESIRTETLDAFAAIPSDGFRAAVQCLPTNDIRSRLGEIHHPACVIVGELDEETPVAYATMLADGLADARLHVLDGVGHLSPAEAPERFNDLVARFLTD